ncbi:hypothetical protein [Clostridium butyricum]|uniref:hypothetical protein n=1 Tax=Clostridium butyricum TaxID=1492 RepID=UPI0022E44C4B|nr:hypothetical protein [Clostridium butyricum]MDU3584378.1 hypothetical protein [Clostridium butyricum]
MMKCKNDKDECYCNKLRECTNCNNKGDCNKNVNDFCTCRLCGKAIRSDGYYYTEKNI